jgi:tripartite-type tricarboxylate transporter receptor subunit TctC
MEKTFIGLLFFPIMAFAWEPTKTITVITPVAPGSGNEMAFRSVSSILEKQGKAKFIFDYKAGADGNIGMNIFSKKPADGLTIAIPACQSTFVASDIHYKHMIEFDPMEFSLVTNIGKSPLAFIASASSNVDNVPELINAVQKENRILNFATGGAAHQLAFEYFMDKVQGNRKFAQNVPYKGPLPAGQDVAAGAVEFGIIPVAVANTLVQTGKIKILGIAGEQKLAAMPNVPLMKDYVPGLNVYACWNIVLPKNTDPKIVQWYTDNFIPALNSSEFKKWADENMIIVDKNAQGSDNLRKDMLSLRAQWQPYVKQMPSPK